MGCLKRITFIAALMVSSALAADLPEGDYIVIVSLLDRTLAHVATKEVDTNGGEYTFSIPLGLLSNSIPTFYACQWRLRGRDLQEFNSKFINRIALLGRYQVFDVGTNSFAQVCARLNLVVIAP